MALIVLREIPEACLLVSDVSMPDQICEVVDTLLSGIDR